MTMRRDFASCVIPTNRISSPKKRFCNRNLSRYCSGLAGNNVGSSPLKSTAYPDAQGLVNFNHRPPEVSRVKSCSRPPFRSGFWCAGRIRPFSSHHCSTARHSAPYCSPSEIGRAARRHRRMFAEAFASELPASVWLEPRVVLRFS